jgi:hypothetical protein
MIIDFQIQVAAFLTAQKAALQAMKLCPPAPITIGGVQVVIDRFEFGANSLRHNQATDFTIFYDFLGETTGMNVAGFQTQLAQDVVVWVTSLNEIMAHPNGAPSIVVPVRGTMIMDLNLFPFNPEIGEEVDQEIYFQATFKRMEMEPLPPLPPGFDPKKIPVPITSEQILQMVNQRVSSLIPSPAIPMGLLSLLPVKPSRHQIVNAGLSVDEHLQRIALRMQVGGGAVSPDAPWRNFFNGFLADQLGANEWSIFLPASYIEQTIQTAIDRAIADVKPEELQIFVGADYSNADGKAGVMVNVLGIYDLPDPLGKLERNPHIPIEISVPAPNTIQLDVGLPEIQELVDSLIPQSLKLFLRLSGPIGALLGALINSFVSDLKDPDLPPNVVRTSPHNVRFTKVMPLPQILNGLSPRITSLLALDDGIALAGTMNARAFTTAALEVISHPFKFQRPQIDCGGAGIELVALFGQSPDLFDILHAEIFVEYAGTLPVYLCSVTPVNDPKGVFPASSLRQDSPQTNTRITVHPPVPPKDYYDDGAYACDILVKTTAGTRFVRIPAPPVLNQQDIVRMRAELLVELGNCELLVSPWYKHFHGYDPHWGIDPLHVVNVLHLWQVEVNGLAQGETVMLAEADRQPLVTYHGRAGQAVKVSALVIPPGGERELSILHGAAPNQRGAPVGKVAAAAEAVTACPGAPPAAKQGIAVRQQLLERVGAIGLGQPCLRVQAARIGGRLCVVAVLEDAVAAFDVTNARAVCRVGHWRMPGVRGAVNWDGGLLLFGENGLAMLDEEGTQTAAERGCEAEGVRDAAAGDGLIYAALPDAVRVFSTRLCPVATVPIEDCRSVLIVGGRLIAAGREGLAILDLTHARKPRMHTHCDDWGVTQLRNGPGTEPDVFVATLEDGSARLLRVHGEGIEEAASFTARPWFVDAVRIGDVLVRIAGNGLEIAQFGASKSM